MLSHIIRTRILELWCSSQEWQFCVNRLGGSNVIGFPREIVARMLVKRREPDFFLELWREHREVVSPPGTGDDVIGIERFSRSELNSTIGNLAWVFAQDMNVSSVDGAPEVWKSDDTEARICPKDTLNVSNKI